MADRKSVVICLTREGMGQAERELSLRLVSNFLHALEAERQMPAAICCYAEGVRLTVEGSPVLANLKTLEALGVPILVCRTCLEYYGLTERVAVGTIGTMAGIVATLFAADSVINL